MTHIGEDKDFSGLVAKALDCEGFNDGNGPELEEGHVGHYTVGFGHQVRARGARVRVCAFRCLRRGEWKLLLGSE